MLSIATSAGDAPAARAIAALNLACFSGLNSATDRGRDNDSFTACVAKIQKSVTSTKNPPPILRIELEYQDVSDCQIAVDHVQEMQMGHGLRHLHRYRCLNQVTDIHTVLLSLAQHVVEAA